MTEDAMFDLQKVQSALRDEGLDGWLLYDFRGLNVLARRVLGFPTNAHATRRWFYFVPANGEPRKLVHRIESGVLAIVGGATKIAMEYVPRNANPYISRVDAGTIELVRSAGVDIVPSGDLIQLFEACWDDEQWQMHLEASRHTESAYHVAWKHI